MSHSYLCHGAWNNGPELIYHMCIKNDFERMTLSGSAYYPATYKQDGFIHATSPFLPNLLLTLANHFYSQTSVDSPWICLALDPRYLDGKVKYEAAASVGAIAPSTSSEHQQLSFPHIFGGITKLAVVAIYNMKRSEDGSFVAIETM